jgi:hypothetical protein
MAAHNFTMPALSPTMTEGNIASWKIKEGDSFSAGDVLLEIETDKASMDVEAQDDGILMKIVQGDGSKGVQVGTRIGVLAEEGDDISKLEMPADESKPATKKEEAKQSTQSSSSEGSKSATASESKTSAPGQRNKSSTKQPKQKYPYYPSVEHLIKEHKLDENAISEITPTGPQGRLLKGDVLAYLGNISADRPGTISARFEHNSHLDLSNIKIKEAPAPKKTQAAEPAAPQMPQTVSLSLPVSFSAAFDAKERADAALGDSAITLTELVFRAIDQANAALPLPANHKPTADELFNSVLGLDVLNPHFTDGRYVPSIEPIMDSSAAQPAAPRKSAKVDIIDILAGTAKKVPRAVPVAPQAVGEMTRGMFNLTVPKGEEKRGQEFLVRVKTVLETKPSSLIL